MPKENKSASRRSRRQCSDVDNEIMVKGTRESLKSAIGTNRYSPFPREVPRRDSRTEKDDVALPTTEPLHSISGSIIGNGIKYIMFPLHLLRFCIFGTSTRPIEAPKDREPEEAKTSGQREVSKDRGSSKDEEKSGTKKEAGSDGSSKEARKSEKTTRESTEETRDATSRNQSSKEEINSDNDDTTDEMVTATEDSDASEDKWSSASSTMMNMSLDFDNFDRSMSYAILEEPMDISIDESALEKSDSAAKTSRDSRTHSSHRVGDSKSELPRASERDRNAAVDEEIAEIFQKQCTSSDDEYRPSYSTTHSCKCEKSKQSNYLYKKQGSYTSSTSKKDVRDGERESKKTESSDFVVSKRRKTVDHEDEKEKRKDRKTESRTREEKRSSRQDTPSKYKSRSSRTPVKQKESKRKDVKYKETATQTDSAFSDDDVEMVPVDTKFSERQYCQKSAARKSLSNYYQDKEREQELHYVADNEDSSDGYVNITHKRISSGSTSSSSTDLGYEETPEKDVSMGLLHSKSIDTLNTLRAYPRAPPGFPDVPQNPPLISCTYSNSKQFVLSCVRDNCPNSSALQTPGPVPPAPTPMRHLYYDYPEFMDLPVNINSSKILKDILKNYYYR